MKDILTLIIVLVVLGILIALYINNQNELRKNRDLFDSLLPEVEKELIANINNFKRGIDGFHIYDSITKIILFEGLTKDQIINDSMFLYRGITNAGYSISFHDRAFNKVDAIRKGRTLKQDSIFESLGSLFNKDELKALYIREKMQDESMNQINKNLDKQSWILNSYLYQPYQADEIDYYLNNPDFKKDIAKYAKYTLGAYNRSIQAFEETLLRNYKMVYDYLESKNIKHSDSLLYGYNPELYKHYLGEYVQIESSGFKTLNTPEKLTHSSIEIELVDGKYIFTFNTDSTNGFSTEIIPVTKYYFRLMDNHPGYYNLIFDQKNMVSGMELSFGTLIFKLEKIE